MEGSNGCESGYIESSEDLAIGLKFGRCQYHDMRVFTLKYHPNDSIARHKACMVARGFTQVYEINYIETFSPVIYLNFICVLLSLVVNQAWCFHWLNVSNVFFFGDLKE